MASCTAKPSDAELDALAASARAENQRRLATQPSAQITTLPDSAWTLTIDGTGPCAHRVLGMSALRELPSVDVRAQNQDRIDVGGDVVTYRGAPVSRLLADCGVDDDAEITFVALDAYRSTIRAIDAKKAPIALAYDRDGAPIPHSEGGPLYLIFPVLDDPDIRARYPSSQFAYYVTHMIVGTEAIKLDVAGAHLDEGGVRAQPSVDRIVQARYRVGWPAVPSKMRGVRVADLLASQQIGDLGERRVGVRTKRQAAVDSDGMALSFDAHTLEACDPLVVYAIGDDMTPIPARLGGPLTIAMNDCPEHAGDTFWPTFVKAIALLPPNHSR